MASIQQIPTGEIVEFCRQQADKHKLDAASAPSKALHDEYVARAMMAEFIAEHFNELSTHQDLSDPEVQNLAREISPAVFETYDSMITRLCHEGHDPAYARRIAMDTYGEQITSALEQASAAISAENSASQNFDAYSRGFEDAILWHVSQATEADRLAKRENTPPRQAKFLTIAKRHRAYADHLRTDLAAKRDTRIKEQSPKLENGSQLPTRISRGPKEEGVPLAVQAAFMKKTEVMDDEGW